MASLSTEKESKLRTKMRMYERAFLDNSKASFEAARNGDRDLQIRYLETALANSARYKKSEKKLAELKEGGAISPEQRLPEVIQAGDKTSSGKVHHGQRRGQQRSHRNTCCDRVRVRPITARSRPCAAVGASARVGAAYSETEVVLPAASSVASGSCSFQAVSASVGGLRRRVPWSWGGL